jgi:hypothetical protein
MGWEKHDVIIIKNDKERRRKEFKGIWLYRNKYGELKDYKERVV